MIIRPIFIPLGFGNWESVVAIFSGMFAKEIIVSTFGVLYGIGGNVSEESTSLVNAISNNFNVISAYSFVVFILFAAPCLAAVSVMKKEFNSWKYTLLAISYQTTFAWIMAFLVYQIGKLFI
jgi:ferrous iron transport protein B